MRDIGGEKLVVTNMKTICKFASYCILILLPLSAGAETPTYDLGSTTNTMRAASNGHPVNLPAGWLCGGVPIGGGNTIRSDFGPPSNALGINGDFYIDLATTPRNLYGPKGGGVWPSPVSMGGPAGPTGAAGQGVPVGGTAGQALTKINSTDYNTQWQTITGTGTVTSVAAVAPLTITGTPTVNPTVNIPASTNSVNGYLTSADHTIFAGKLDPSGNGGSLSGITYPQIGGTQTPAQIPDSVINSSWQTITQSGGTLTLACDTKKPSQKQTTTLSANVTTFTITSVFNGATGELIVKQPPAGGKTLALPSGSIVVNGGGGIVSLTLTANAIDYLTWSYDGTNYYWAYGKNFN